MTVLEALRLGDLTRPNEFEPELKLRWLSALDGLVTRELYEAHEGWTGSFAGYDEDTDLQNTQLLIPRPWDDIYVRYLVMRIDLENGELDRYNQDAAAFNRIYQSYAGHYTHHHRPLQLSALRF